MTSIGDNVYVVWTNATFGSSDIFFRASNDAGRTFGSIINLSNDTEISVQPQVAAFGDNVYVAWRGGNDIDFISSNDKGQTFGDPQSISSGNSQSPKISAFADNVYVVWEEFNTNFEIGYAVSNDNGLTFGPSLNLSNNLGDSQFPAVATFGENVYVVWQDNTLGNFEIYYILIEDNGLTFGTFVNLSNNAGSSERPQIAAAGNNIYVIWHDIGPGNDIFYAASYDNGQNFRNSPVDISNNPGISLFPKITATQDNVYVVWEDSTPGNSEIFFRGSNDFEPIRLTNTATPSTIPKITSVGDNVYVVWQDPSLGNSEVFYRGNTQISIDPIDISNSLGHSSDAHVSAN
jgi:hypothetical protein